MYFEIVANKYINLSKQKAAEDLKTCKFSQKQALKQKTENNRDFKTNNSNHKNKQKQNDATHFYYNSKCHVFQSKKTNKKDKIQSKLVVKSLTKHMQPPQLKKSPWHTQNTTTCLIFNENFNSEPEMLLQSNIKSFIFK